MSISQPEILVLGGGPAGCAAARLLALWGHRVHVRSRPLVTGARLAESVPPSCGKLFDAIGVRSGIDAADFVRTTGNTVWWGDAEMRAENFVGELRGWQVTADALEAILRDACVHAGAHIDSTRASIDDVSATSAPFVLDCTGRAGLVARARDVRVYEDAHRTVALVGTWRAAAWRVPDPTHTLIESYADGWAWSVPVADDARYVAVMVDPRTSNLAKGDGALETYRSELRKTRQFAALLSNATLEAGPWGWDASMYFAKRYVDGNVLFVGDAGSFIDPLSSAGIKKALASGWLAAVTVHTALVKPSMRATALDFFDAREAEIYAAFRRMTASYLAEAAAGQSNPFWSDRSTALDEGTLDDQARVEQAFRQLRDAPSVQLRRHDGVLIEPRAAVSGCEIVLEPRLVTASLPQGIRFVRDVDVVALLEIAPTRDQVPDLFETYCARYGPVSLPDFLSALSTAVANGWLTM